MVSRGQDETRELSARIQAQLNRLMTELQDLEELKDELSQEEYDSMKASTRDQLLEFEQQLEKWKSGDMTLVDDINAAQLRIKQAISGSSQASAVVEMFQKREPEAIRNRMVELERDLKLNKISEQQFNVGKYEALVALQKLGAEISASESDFIISMSSAGNRVAASSQINEQGIFNQARGNIPPR